jgi:NDP-sugar pyrophosphorylase family protein
MKEKISITLNSKRLKEVDALIDYILIRNRSQAIEYLINKALGDQKNAVILAGGDAERQSLGHGIYRSIIPIHGVPLIENSLRKLRENGFRNVFFVAEKPILSAVFNVIQDGNRYGIHVVYIEDSHSSGTMESLRKVRGKISTSFLAVYGDIFFNKINLEALWNDHILNQGICTLMLTTAHDPTKKGIVKMEGNRVLDFIQKPKNSDVYLGFSSMFIAEPEIFEYNGKSLESDIFPQLARTSTLFGHISSEKEVHLHTIKDVDSIKKN